MPDPLFTDLYRDTEQLTWEPTEQVRQRGQQRTRRTRIVAGLASMVAVAVVAGGATILAGGQDRTSLPAVPPIGSPGPTPSVASSPMPTPSIDPSRTTPLSPSAAATGGPSQGVPSTGRPSNRPPTNPAVPLVAMLQPADVPSGYRPHDPEYLGDWGFAFSVSTCQSPDHRLFRLPERAERIRAFDGGHDKPLNQRVTRHSSQDAARFVDLVRDRVTTCDSTFVTLTVLSSGFAGDESVLVRADFREGGASLYIFVRQGDLVSEVWQKGMTGPAAARDLGRAAAERLCTGTDAC